jgi:acetyl esterase
MLRFAVSMRRYAAWSPPSRPSAPADAVRGLKLAAALLAVSVLAGCSTSGGATPSSTPTPAATSQAAGPSGTRLELGLPFATVDGVTLRLDACLPSGSGAHPTLVMVPGGGFTQRTRDFLQPECIEGAQHGFATFVVDYRLATEGSKGATVYPGQVQDVERAIRWIRSPVQAKRFGADPSNAVLLGESAGAIVASEIAVGTAGARLPKSTFKGVALFSGVYDFGRPDLSAYLIGVGKAYLGCTPSAACALTRTASAANFVKADDPPMLLVNSATELVGLVQPQEFDAKLTGAGVQHQLIVAPGVYHALDIARKSASVNRALWAYLKARTSGK